MKCCTINKWNSCIEMSSYVYKEVIFYPVSLLVLAGCTLWLCFFFISRNRDACIEKFCTRYSVCYCRECCFILMCLCSPSDCLCVPLFSHWKYYYEKCTSSVICIKTPYVTFFKFGTNYFLCQFNVHGINCWISQHKVGRECFACQVLWSESMLIVNACKICVSPVVYVQSIENVTYNVHIEIKSRFLEVIVYFPL